MPVGRWPVIWKRLNYALHVLKLNRLIEPPPLARLKNCQHWLNPVLKPSARSELPNFCFKHCHGIWNHYLAYQSIGWYSCFIIKYWGIQGITLEQKQDNQKKARTRVVVEHLIRLVKTFRIAAERLRLKSTTYEPVILAVCGLIRWRIGAIVRA